MPETEARSERMSMTLTPSQLAALKFIAGMHPEKYDGFSGVLEDFSLNDAVQAHSRAIQLANRGAA